MTTVTDLLLKQLSEREYRTARELAARCARHPDYVRRTLRRLERGGTPSRRPGSSRNDGAAVSGG